MPGRSLQGGLPMDKFWEKRIAKSLETDMMICARALPQDLQAALGVQVPVGWEINCRKGDQNGQGLFSLRRTHPLHPLCALPGPQAPEHPEPNGT